MKRHVQKSLIEERMVRDKHSQGGLIQPRRE
jgi:hypothetical protein